MAEKINRSAFIICLLLVAAVSATVNNHYVFEFGQNVGTQIFDKQGNIPFLSYNTKIPITEPRRMKISYVRVVVDALSAPKVDFDSDTRTVTIHYSLTQVPVSSYEIFVKAVPEV